MTAKKRPMINARTVNSFMFVSAETKGMNFFCSAINPDFKGLDWFENEKAKL
jgi:hypothetical protein